MLIAARGRGFLADRKAQLGSLVRTAGAATLPKRGQTRAGDRCPSPTRVAGFMEAAGGFQLLASHRQKPVWRAGGSLAAAGPSRLQAAQPAGHVRLT